MSPHFLSRQGRETYTNTRSQYKPIGSNNMKALEKNKGIVIAVVVFVMVIVAYNMFFKADPLLEVPVVSPAVEQGSDIVELYDSLQAVTFEEHVFSSSVYRSLVDFSTPIP